MAITVEIKCINKANRFDPHERIINVGGVYDNGNRWKKTQQQAIVDIDTGQIDYFVRQAGATVRVIVALHNGRKYIKTQNDGLQPDNLLRLPECPVGG